MSYLDRPRLTFFGQFTANPSTINNTPTNYGMPLPYQDVAWNPYGRHNFSLNDCTVTNVVMDGVVNPLPVKGTVTTAQDGVLVDLDTQQQGVSQIIGMKLTVTLDGASVSGSFVPVNFFDIFIRTNNDSSAGVLSGDGRFSAAYQTVLTDLQWNESGSPFLTALKAASPEMLSIRMNVDGYHDGTTGAALFTTGRVAGTIGPQLPNEPTTFTNARYLRPSGTASGFGSFNFAQAKSDPQRGKLVVDLGNAVPTTWPSGDFPVSVDFPSPLQIATVVFDRKTQAWVADKTIGDFDASEAAYQANAFVQELDIPAGVSLASSPTGVISPEQGGIVVMFENPTGAFINADEYVYRMNPGDAADVTLWANTFEEPAAGIDVMLFPSLSGLGGAPGMAVGTPPSGLLFPSNLTTDSDGQATFTMTASNPGNPRGPIDGQVYGVGWTWMADVNPDPSAFVSVHVFDSVPIPDAPTWWEDLFPILVQYSYLYPAMQKIIALDDYQQVVDNVTVIIQRLTLPEGDPGYMPITRELSADKLAILLKWANDPEHPIGTEPVPPPVLPPLPRNTAPPTSGSGR
jgi:hypothetical protein